MAADAMRYVVCYDVPDDKRRLQIAKCLDGYGDRVQYSVFEAVLDRTLLDKLIEDLRTLMDAKEDRVVVYALCAACASRSLRLGRAGEGPAPGEEAVFIV